MEFEVQYTVVIRKPSTSFGKGNVVKVIENPHSLGWSEYVNDVGEAFFTLSQEDPKAGHPILDSSEGPAPEEETWRLENLIYDGYHMEIYRNGELVWAGWVGETDETVDDVIIYGYSYASALYSLLSDWDHEWTATNADTIISDLWTRAKTTLTDSPLAWCATGTIQTLWSESGGPTTLQLPFYNIFRKRILIAMKEIAAFAISDTTNKVMFEITPGGTFNLWRHRGGTYLDSTANFNRKWIYGSGAIRSFHRLTKPVDRRTDLYAVGSSPNDVDLQATASDASLRTAIGRREEPLYFQWVRDQTELDRVTNQRMKRASRLDTDLSIAFNPNSVIPFRATGADYTLTDDLFIGITTTGVTSVGEPRTVVGQQIVYHRNVENVKLLLVDAITA